MALSEGLLHAFELDGKGGGTPLDWEGVNRLWNVEGLVWVHLDYSSEQSQAWLKESSGLDKSTWSALITEETRPRSEIIGDGLLINLRGVNLNPGADPEDMVSLRMWVEKDRIITLKQRKLMAVEDVRQSIVEGRGPHDAGGVLLKLADRLLARAGGVVSNLDDEADALEDEVLNKETYELRGRIARIRRQAIAIRRFLAPQRDAMYRLFMEDVPWLMQHHRLGLRELSDRTTRIVEDLDSIRDRAAVTQEELHARLAEQTNKTMYVLSLVAGVFLPLGLLTGLLGINVGGMPGVDSPLAFWITCAILAVIAAAEIYIFKRMKWF